jgi:Na+/proline symporter
MMTLSIILIVVNLLFLSLGALLFIYSNEMGISIPEIKDNLFPELALGNSLGGIVGVFFILGLIAAAYSSADSALTALTTSVCIDFLDIAKKSQENAIRTRKKIHVLMSFLLYIVIMLFSLISDESVVSSLFKAAGYTYGPLLGLYAFGMIHKKEVRDQWVPWLCLITPLITYWLQYNSEEFFGGYRFGFELIILNGLLTYLGIHLIAIKSLNQSFLKK